jgi:hypothetical protein
MTLATAHKLAIKKFGDVGMFSYLRTRNGNIIYGKYISYKLNRIITKKELL